MEIWRTTNQTNNLKSAPTLQLNLLTTANKRLFHTQCLPQACHKLLQCVFTVGLEASVCFCPLLWGAPVPLLLFLHCTLSGRRGRRVDSGRGQKWGQDRGDWGEGTELELGKPCLLRVVVVGREGEGVTCSDRLRRPGSQLEGTQVL